MGFNFTLFHHYQTLLTHPQSSSDRGPFVFVQCWGTKVKSVTVDISFRPVCSDPKAITTHHLFPYLFSCPSGSHGHSTAVQLLFLIWIFMELFLFQLFMIDNCADDWRIAMTWQRMMQIGEREQYTIFYTGCHAFHDYKLRTQLPWTLKRPPSQKNWNASLLESYSLKTDPKWGCLPFPVSEMSYNLVPLYFSLSVLFQ